MWNFDPIALDYYKETAELSEKIEFGGDDWAACSFEKEFGHSLTISRSTYMWLHFRFSPSVFLYLGSVVPGILILEIDRIDRHRADLDNNTDAADKSQEEIGLSNLQGVLC